MKKVTNYMGLNSIVSTPFSSANNRGEKLQRCPRKWSNSHKDRYDIFRFTLFCLIVPLFGLQLVKEVRASPLEEVQEITISEDSSELEVKENSTAAFATKGLKRWYGQGAAGIDVNDASSFGLLGAGISHFFANGHSINAELNSLYFAQTGEDALGLNLAVLLRWHFHRQPNWSLYIDGGAGVLGTTSKVPSRGSSFNFTPQVGGGATIQLSNQQRLMLGLRWHHISNGELYESNPGRDSIMGYVGLNLPR